VQRRLISNFSNPRLSSREAMLEFTKNVLLRFVNNVAITGGSRHLPNISTVLL
jgi:hypothetical protein